MMLAVIGTAYGQADTETHDELWQHDRQVEQIP